VTAALVPAARTAARIRDWLSVRHALRVEAALVVGLYASYEASRGVVAGSPALAERHAGEVVSIERSLHVFVEGDVQRAADHLGGLASALGIAYLTLHLALTGLVLIWLHRRRPAAYPIVRTTLLLASGFALVGYLAFPTAPPRLSGLGIVDTVSGHLSVNLNKGFVSGLYNPYAALPSMHAGYALVVGAALFSQGKHNVTRAAGVVYPALVVLVIVATGNHFLLDAGAGAFVDLVAVGLTLLLLQPRAATPAIPLEGRHHSRRGSWASVSLSNATRPGNRARRSQPATQTSGGRSRE
jgi:hypothetical protein